MGLRLVDGACARHDAEDRREHGRDARAAFHVCMLAKGWDAATEQVSDLRGLPF